uniref:Uncharacterized protein n=1 Tax=Romanomermis culicivorax TaxID=13658 RepID=A0A915I357_ROMCU
MKLQLIVVLAGVKNQKINGNETSENVNVHLGSRTIARVVKMLTPGNRNNIVATNAVKNVLLSPTKKENAL